MFIYKITNNINNKIYIGLTTKEVSKRFLEHCRETSNCTKLRRAIFKYGKENFTVEEIDGALSISELNYKEQHYIHLYNSVEKGYNLASGGRFSKHSKETRERLSKINTGKIHSKSTRKKISENNHWKGKKGSLHNRSKSVVCVDTGEIYGSIHEASRKIGITASNICAVLKGRRKTTKGMTFKYLEE